MTNLIQSLTEAIIKQEGMPADYTNPGNLRAAPWLKNPVITNNFWHPVTRAEGVAGAAHVVALRIAMGQSLRQLISAWAPPSDGNNTEQYIRNVSEWAGLQGPGDLDRPLYELIE